MGYVCYRLNYDGYTLALNIIVGCGVVLIPVIIATLNCGDDYLHHFKIAFCGLFGGVIYMFTCGFVSLVCLSFSDCIRGISVKNIASHILFRK